MGVIKVPLKHRIGVIFWQGSGSRMQTSSFYLHFSPDELFVAVGVRWFEKPMLDAYREYIKDEKNRANLAKILKNITKKGYKIIDKGYKRHPRGFSADMPNVELSLYKGMATYTTMSSSIITDGDKLIDTLYKCYEDMLELQQEVYKISLYVKN